MLTEETMDEHRDDHRDEQRDEQSDEQSHEQINNEKCAQVRGNKDRRAQYVRPSD